MDESPDCLGPGSGRSCDRAYIQLRTIRGNLFAMRSSLRANAMRVLQAALPRSNRDSGLVRETIQSDLTRFLRYRVATLEAALCRVEELRRAAAQGDLEPCNPPIR